MSLKLVIQNKVINNLSHFSSDYLKQQLDQTQDKESDNAIEIYFTLGEELFSIGEFNESLKYHQTCLEIKKKRNKDAKQLAKSYLPIGIIYSMRNEKEKAKEIYLEAEKLTNLLGTNNEISADIYYHLGDIYLDLNNFSKAKEYHEKSLKIKLEHKDIGYVHYTTAASHFQLGRIQRNLNNLAESVESLKKAKKIYEDIYSDNYPQICNINIELGKTFSIRSEFYKAIEHYNIAKVKLISFNPESCELANVYSLLGNVYSNVQEYSISESFYRKALEIYIKVKGVNDITTASCYHNIGLIFKNRKEFDNASEQLNKALKIFQEQPVKDYHQIASCLVNIGLNYAMDGNTRLCEENLEQALKIRREKENETSEIADIYFNLGCLKQGLDSTYNEAMKLFENSLEIRKKIHQGENHYDIASIYNNFGQMSFERNKFDEALKHFNKVSNIYENLYGKTNVFSADFYQSTGKTFFEKNKLEEAINFFLKAISSREDIKYDLNERNSEESLVEMQKSKDLNSEKVGISYMFLAKAFSQADKNDKAKDACQKAIIIFSEVKGDKGMDTIKCQNLLKEICNKIS